MKYLSALAIALFAICTNLQAAPEKKVWQEPFSQESHEDVAKWLNVLLSKFYTAYLQDDVFEMKKINEQIKCLYHLEFRTDRLDTDWIREKELIK